MPYTILSLAEVKQKAQDEAVTRRQNEQLRAAEEQARRLLPEATRWYYRTVSDGDGFQGLRCLGCNAHQVRVAAGSAVASGPWRLAATDPNGQHVHNNFCPVGKVEQDVDLDRLRRLAVQDALERAARVVEANSCMEAKAVAAVVRNLGEGQ